MPTTLEEPGVSERAGSDERVALDERASLDSPWVTLVWNDPVNLMTYVSYVFRSYFGFSREEAERRMLQVHHEGRAVVATGSREEMERHVEAMHDFGLWATLQKADA
jgi:ATP-dependent Clp protease adaptor protein ClpS